MRIDEGQAERQRRTEKQNKTKMKKIWKEKIRK
jgi:hypothetical protein